MELGDLLVASALGLLAGVLSGLFGVGGGIVFVPALTLGVGLAQLDAEATSLAAMIPVVVVGAWRQRQQRLVRLKDATFIGVASIPGVLGGAAVATQLSDDTLRRAFGAFLVLTAAQLAWRARPPRGGETGTA